MPNEARIQEVVEQVLGSERSPEEVCGDDRVLLDDVMDRLRHCRLLGAEIDALFPSSGADLLCGSAPSTPRLLPLPKVPGYEIEAVIGHGGVGAVYKARHLGLDRVVAIKMLLAGPFASASELARFIREAKSIAALHHPNIVQVYDVGDVEGHPYYTMEFCEGGTLAQMLAGKPLGAAEAVDIVLTLARAVNAAHVAGIIHRDLKPSNILLTNNGGLKISDFGLARFTNANSSITIEGARLGTPSYMSPEQASGSTTLLSPAVDIYALGAILYEILTGRPPFLAKSPAETQRLILQQDPVPPLRINHSVPRDLDTVCLKCLHKEPQRRYGSAPELAADLERFQRGEPIAARPAGTLERTVKWVKRHPSLAMTLAAGILMVTSMTCAGFWLTMQRAKLTHAVEMDLAKVASQQQQARWNEATATLDQTIARLNGGGPDILRQQIAHASRDLKLVITLDRIRMDRVTGAGLIAYRKQASDRYTEAFRDAKLGTFDDAPDVVAARIIASPISAALIGAVDDWSLCPSDKQQENWVLAVARAANGDGSTWASRIFESTTWNDPGALGEIARTIPVDKQPLPLLLALGERQIDHYTDISNYLRRVQAEHPDDFWANFILGTVLLMRNPVEARGYYRGALSARPDLAVAYCAMGDTYVFQQSVDEAVHYYEKSIHMDPNYGRGYVNLGLARQFQGKLDDAIELYRKSINLDPNYVWSYYNLGQILAARGKYDLALSTYQTALELDPGNTSVERGIRTVLMQQNRIKEVWNQWHNEIATEPDDFNEWWGYPELAVFLGKDSDYRQTRTALLRRFGNSTDPLITEKIGRACLMLPGSDEEMQAAANLINISVSARTTVDDKYAPYFFFAQALANYRLNRTGDVVKSLQLSSETILWPSPRLLLAMIQFRQGHVNEAKKTLAFAVTAFNWDPAQANSRDVWLAHILRREAETLIVPDLPQLLAGSAKPKDSYERLTLLGTCEFQRLYPLESRTLSDAFANDPTLRDYPSVDLRFTAARAAAMAAHASVNGGTPVNEAERSYWRKQAINWLDSDLAQKTNDLIFTDKEAWAHLKEQLMRWRYEPDLAAIRDPADLQSMSAEDRGACAVFWNKVNASIAQTQDEKQAAPAPPHPQGDTSW